MPNAESLDEDCAGLPMGREAIPKDLTSGWLDSFTFFIWFVLFTRALDHLNAYIDTVRRRFEEEVRFQSPNIYKIYISIILLNFFKVFLKN